MTEYHAYPSIPRRRAPIWPAVLTILLSFVAFCGLVLPLVVHHFCGR